MTSMTTPQSLTLAVDGTSVLDQRQTLHQLLELGSFREVMRSFADLYRVGIKVFDMDGTKLVDIRVASTDLDAYLFGFGGTRQASTRLVTSLKNDPFEIVDGRESPRVMDSFSGLRFVVVPITHEGDLYGRIIFGPFFPEGVTQPDEALYNMEPQLDRSQVEALAAPIQRMDNQEVSRVLTHVQKVVEVIVFTRLRTHLTSQMHIESVTGSYSELEAKNRELQENNEKLKELDKLKSAFLATVSHELRTPLTSVIGYSEMLLEGIAGEMNEEQREYVSTIMEKGESLLELISQILDLSKIESGSMRLHKEDFDVEAVVRHAMTSVLPQAQKKSIDLKVEVGDGLPFYRGDKTKIKQILINLMGNAVKFTPEEGTIITRATLYTGQRKYAAQKDDDDFGAGALFDLDEETFVRLDVKDSGIGIPKDKLESVFERFFQVDNSSTREYGGTGLGLSIVRNFAEAHGGEVWVDSDEGQGATFTVLLPVAG
jgi:signal transduction histidine kinase